MQIPFDFYNLKEETAWLLGFIFADATIGYHQDGQKVRLYNSSKELLESIKEYYQIPYKVVEQRNLNNTLYFIRFSDPNFVESIVFHGFQEDKSNLSIPKMDKAKTKAFLKGFMKGKGSFFEEQATGAHGFKIIYRSEGFINEVALKLSELCRVKISRPHCRLIKNCVSCQIKYVGSDFLKVQRLLTSDFIEFD